MNEWNYSRGLRRGWWQGFVLASVVWALLRWAQ